MRKLIFQMMISLDGFYEGTNAEIDWHIVDDEFNNYAIDLLHNVDTLVFGRKTYELMAGYWPTPDAMTNDPVVAGFMNNLKKNVFSKTLSTLDPIPIGWHNSILIKEGVSETISKLKQEPGKDMAIFGSSDLALTFIEHNLIDEFQIILSPIVLGKGKTLFKGLEDSLKLKLLKTRIFHSGNVLLYYQPGQK